MKEISKSEANIIFNSKYDIDYFKKLFYPLYTISIGDKIHIHDDNIIVYKKSFLQGFYRWYNKDSRINTRENMNILISKYELYIDTLLGTFENNKVKLNEITCMNVKLSIAMCSLGETYYDDENTSTYFFNISLFLLHKNDEIKLKLNNV